MYSIATNYTFKWPVLAGALACLLSNLLYVLSYDSRALWLLVLSRFTMGFGAPMQIRKRSVILSCWYWMNSAISIAHLIHGTSGRMHACMRSEALCMHAYQNWIRGGVWKGLTSSALACLGPAAGSSRTVSRRYIADFVSKRDRMRASTGAAAGTACCVNFPPPNCWENINLCLFVHCVLRQLSSSSLLGQYKFVTVGAVTK